MVLISAQHRLDSALCISVRALLRVGRSSYQTKTILTMKMTYELCPPCQKPLINEGNLKILRTKWIAWGVGGLTLTVAGGAVGAYALPYLGFKSAGVAAGSYAAGWQGPAVAAGSAFAISQSLGATGLGMLLFGATGSAVGGVGALGLVYKYRDKFDWCSCDLNADKTQGKL